MTENLEDPCTNTPILYTLFGKGAESRPNQKPLKSLNITIYRTTNYSIYLTIEIE